MNWYGAVHDLSALVILAWCVSKFLLENDAEYSRTTSRLVTTLDDFVGGGPSFAVMVEEEEEEEEELVPGVAAAAAALVAAGRRFRLRDVLSRR